MKVKQTPVVPWALTLAAAALLGACQSAPRERRAEAPLPAQITERLGTVREENPGYPKFGDVPAPPANVRSPEQWRQFVTGVEGEGAALERWAATNPVWNTDMGRFVSAARSALAPAGPPPPPDQQAQTEAYVRRMRELARPPAPPSPQ